MSDRQVPPGTPSSELPEGYEWCTSTSRRKRHISNGLRVTRHAPRPTGRGGRTLCGVYGEDQDRAQWEADIFSPGRTIVVAELPLCQLCAKSMAKRVAA